MTWCDVLTRTFCCFCLNRAVFVYQDAKNIVLGAKGEDGFAGALSHFHEDSRAYAVRRMTLPLTFSNSSPSSPCYWPFHLSPPILTPLSCFLLRFYSSSASRLVTISPVRSHTDTPPKTLFLSRLVPSAALLPSNVPIMLTHASLLPFLPHYHYYSSRQVRLDHLGW